MNISQLHPEMVFPFRTETADVIKFLMRSNDHWLLKYHLALIEWNCNNTDLAKQLYESVGNTSDYAPFYASRAKFNMKQNPGLVLSDLQQAAKMDNSQWRYGKYLITWYLSHKQNEAALQAATDYKNRFRGNFVIDMLYAKSLLHNKKYSEADDLLKTIQILPNEGATGGRELYKETQLMLAIEGIKNKQYDKALQNIKAARIWPENLGVGKPYDSDIDERLEDWLAYEAYTKQDNKKDAKDMLNKILLGSNENTTSINNLVTAWALQKMGKSSEAKKLLSDWLEKKPNDVYANWAKTAYDETYKSLPEDVDTNENYRVLDELIKLKNMP